MTIVQEGRFQLMDSDGVAHHFIAAVALEPEQMASLLGRHVRVFYVEPAGIIGHRAKRVFLLEDC